MKQLALCSIEELKLRPLLQQHFNGRSPIKRPSWDEIFIDIAATVAKKSHDAQTQFGSVIVNKSNHIVSTGFNGFMPDIDDNVLANTRPLKYPFMMHSEHNAILQWKNKEEDCRLYVTGIPCIQCWQIIWSAGIREVVYPGNGKVAEMLKNEEYKENFDLLQYLWQGRMKIRVI